MKQKNFEFFTHSVLGMVSDTATIVAFRLASCRDTNSSWIHKKDKDIIEDINIGKTAFTKSKKELLETGILLRVDGVYQLNTEYFPVFQRTLSLEMMERSNALLEMAKNGIKIGLVYAYYYKRDFQDLRQMTPDSFLQWCEAGCEGLKVLHHGFVDNIYQYEFI